MNSGAINTGTGISEEIMLTFSRRKPETSVTIGEGLQFNVASFYAKVYPWFMDEPAIIDSVDEFSDEDYDESDSELDI